LPFIISTIFQEVSDPLESIRKSSSNFSSFDFPHTKGNGLRDGKAEGLTLGTPVGIKVGVLDGLELGELVGIELGILLGTCEGLKEGLVLGI